jgi:hypothetical protein
MADNIHSQYDFFQAIQLDGDGNLLVKITNLTGGTGGDNYYTTGATLSGATIIFDRNDTPAAYSVDLSSIAGGGNIDGGTAFSIPIDLNIDGGGA